MSNAITITSAPRCWGWVMWTTRIRHPGSACWQAAQAGFGGLELGPYGYVPLAAERVSEAQEADGLRIVAGTIFDDLVAPDNRAKTRERRSSSGRVQS